MAPEATSLASCGEMRNFVHVWVCRRGAPNSREVVPALHRRPLFRGAASLEACAAGWDLSPAGREGLLLWKGQEGNPLLLVPGREGCWVSGEANPFFFGGS